MKVKFIKFTMNGNKYFRLGMVYRIGEMSSTIKCKTVVIQ